MDLILKIEITSSVDDEERVELTEKLRQHLSELDELEKIDSPALPKIPGNKSAGIDLQTLLVTLAASGGVLTTLTGAVQSWLTRQDRSSVTIEAGGDKLTITGASSDTQKRLVDAWIDRHKG
jgi:hypothetical protein